MVELPNLNTIDNNVLDNITYHKQFTEGVENYVRLNSVYRRILQNILINLMLDSGIYDFELNKERSIDASHYDIVIKTNAEEETAKLSIVFPNQTVEDVL